MHLSTSYRDFHLENTWSILNKILKDIGVTRVADITGLDRIGVPVFQATRPETKYPSSIFAGKGVSLLESRVSACMEAYESFVSENHAPNLIFENGQIKSHHCISLRSLIVPKNIDITTFQTEWLPVKLLDEDLSLYGEEKLVPKELVLMPCQNKTSSWSCHTNGIASGNTYYDALLHSIFEIIERDALSLALVMRQAHKVHSTYMDHPIISDLINKIEYAGLKLIIKDITNDLEIPTYYALILDPLIDTPWYYSGGSGANLNPIIALTRAITEAVQSRCCMISGAREDLRRETIKAYLSVSVFKEIYSYWFTNDGENPVKYETVNSNEVSDVLKNVIRKLKRSNYKIYWYDFGPSNLTTFKVVRCIIPGLESFFIDKTRIGKRLLTAQPKLKKFLTNNPTLGKDIYDTLP